ncbi:MAG: hypothetical protein WCX95_00500 [Candidatus Gracilibacteria bacterium]
MKKNIGFVVVLAFGLLMMQACSLPWGGGQKIASMEIAYNNGSVTPEIYQEAVMDITPDYELRTIAVNYKMEHPVKVEKLLEDTFKGDAVIGGEYFDRFGEVNALFEEENLDSGEPCDGGYEYFVTIKTKAGEESSKSIFSCGEKVAVIDEFYDDIISLLTENVF